MPRITVTLDEEQDEWVAERAEERDRPKAYIIRDLIEAHRTGEASTDSSATEPTRTGSGPTTEDVEELRDRVGHLERAFRDLLPHLDEIDDIDVEDVPTPGAASSAAGRERREGETNVETQSTTDERNVTAAASRPPGGPVEHDPDADPVEAYMDAFATNWSQHVEERRSAVRAALEWLRDDARGWATRSNFEDALLPEHEVVSQSTDSWWRTTVRPALQAAVDVGLVEYRPGSHDYAYAGEIEDLEAAYVGR